MILHKSFHRSHVESRFLTTLLLIHEYFVDKTKKHEYFVMFMCPWAREPCVSNFKNLIATNSRIRVIMKLIYLHNFLLRKRTKHEYEHAPKSHIRVHVIKLLCHQIYTWPLADSSVILCARGRYFWKIKTYF